MNRPSPRPSVPRTKRDGLRFGPYALASLLLLALACLASGLAPHTSHAAGAHGASRALSFEERVAYQRAVEEVYWRHTLWPAENQRPKPGLDEVVPLEATRARVEETLRQSEALARRWNRPVAPEQLQAEVTRMARETRRPEVLRELWRALGDDPFVIAEVLARPALVERLARGSFAADEKKADDAGQASFDSWWAAEGRQYTAAVPADEGFTYQLAEVNNTGADDTWKPTQSLPVGTGTIVWTGAEVIIWGGGTSQGGSADAGSRYNPATDTWATTTTVGAPQARHGQTAVWTGTEMIVWGGSNQLSSFSGINDGGRYNPATDTWTPTSTTNAPTGRRSHTAVWTGSKMVVWGGCAPGSDNACPSTRILNSGGVYDPATDSWTPTSTAGSPTARSSHRAVWTGAEMMVWGSSNTGGLYNPGTNGWRSTTTLNAPSARAGFSFVWTGTEAVVWGGYEGNFVTLNTGARYNPQTNTWTPTSRVNSAAARFGHTAVWAGAEMILYGGDLRPAGNIDQVTNTGARYNPATDSWAATSTAGAPVKNNHVAVWTGEEMFVWGGNHFSQTIFKAAARYKPANDSWTPTNNNDSAPAAKLGVWSGAELIVWGKAPGCNSGCGSTGGRYDPVTNLWRPINVTNAPAGDYADAATAVWTGKEMIVAGGRYNPLADTWTRMSTVGAPANFNAPAVWTGTELLVWGGSPTPEGSPAAAGGRYNPETDTWRLMSTTDAPTARSLHNAVWTGGEMVVWGGSGYFAGSQINTGGRYNPQTDTWRPTATANAPEARLHTSAVWTGTEMIVWGGWVYNVDGTSRYLNTGARYNPATDSWTPTATAGAPSARSHHRAVWTGSQMIVWGGLVPVTWTSTGDPVYTGARYNPATDGWTPTSLQSPPSRRDSHVQVWTGTQMIVWGGTGVQSQGGGIYNAPGAAAGNTPPSVRLTSPSPEGPFEAGGRVRLAAEASDPDGRVTSVRFYANDTLLGTDDEAPFAFDWTGMRSGDYALTATASDNAGGVTRSAAVNINVEALIGPPNAVITSPADGATFEATDTIRVAADVTPNPDYAVTKVEFHLSDGSGTHTLVHTDTDAPYGFDLRNKSAGSYIIYAYAYDGSDVGLSPGARFTIKPSPGTHTISGRLTDQNGLAIPGAFVNVLGPYSETKLSDPYGYYSFQGLEAGAEHTIQVYKEGYDFDPAHQTFTNLSASQTANFNGAKRGSPVNIGGRIVDANGAPAQGIRVQLESSAPSPQYRTTDANGYYQFTNMPAGDNFMIIPDGLYGSFGFGPSYRDYQPLIRHVTDANFVATRLAYSISGRVTVGGVPRAGANVTLGGGLSVNATTDADGRYGFYGLAGGTAYSVTPSLAGHTFTPSSFTTTGLTNDITADFNGAAPTTGPVNVALPSNGGTVSVSSAYDSRFVATSLNNGDRKGLNWGTPGGGWNDATANSYPDWVEVSFSGEKAINQVDVFTVQDNFASPAEPTEAMTFAQYGVTSFEAQYWTGAAWATIPNAAAAANRGVWRRFTFAPLTTSKIRILITGALDGYSRLVEVEAWQGAPTPAPTPTPVPAAGRVNVALSSQGATAAASSQHSSSFPASAAINGDRKGLNWGSGGGWNDATGNSYPDWLEVTFAGARTIDEVGVFTLQDAFSSPAEPTEATTFTQYGVTSFEAQYWTGSGWAGLPGGQVGGNNRAWRRLTFAAVTTTKVRILVTGALNGSSRLVEVEAWQVGGTVPTRTNHALSSNGGAASASSTYDSRFPVAGVNDGDRKGLNWGAGGGWNDATGNAYPDWVEVSFGGAKAVSEVNVFTVQDAYAAPSEPTEALTFTKYGVTQFDVQAWDGAQWVTVQGGAVTGNDKVWRKLTFSPVTTSKIRVLVGNGLGGYSRITEVEAY